MYKTIKIKVKSMQIICSIFYHQMIKVIRKTMIQIKKINKRIHNKKKIIKINNNNKLIL